jgi:hypothetical protein
MWLVQVLTADPMPAKRQPKPAPRLAKIQGLLDDFPNRNEFTMTDDGFARAIERASLKTPAARSLTETRQIHDYEEKLEFTKKRLVARMVQLAKENMGGIQLQAFLLSFQFGVNKCVTARSMKVSRQSIQIRNKRAIRRLKGLIYTDKTCIVLIAEMQRLRRRLVELDEVC